MWPFRRKVPRVPERIRILGVDTRAVTYHYYTVQCTLCGHEFQRRRDPDLPISACDVYCPICGCGAPLDEVQAATRARILAEEEVARKKRELERLEDLRREEREAAERYARANGGRVLDIGERE